MSPLFGLFGFALLAVGAGVSFVMQQAVNADLRSALGSAAWAGFISYLGGTLCMLALAVVCRDGLPSTAAVLRSNWWAWSGGFFGAIYIAISILLVPGWVPRHSLRFSSRARWSRRWSSTITDGSVSPSIQRTPCGYSARCYSLEE